MNDDIAVDDRLVAGRDSFDRLAWGDAYANLAVADRSRALTSEDLERLAIAAHLRGRPDDAASAWSRAHVEAVRAGDVGRAARCAIWLGIALVQRGEMAPASGWFGRAARLIEETGYDGVELGYLCVPEALGALREGDAATALGIFDQVAAIADRFGDPDLMALGRLGRGESLIDLAERARGLQLLDEAMVSVIAGEVSPIVTGIIYCSVIETCQKLFDLRRAQEWTAALSRWCESQPDLIPYRGQCLVYRSELMRFHGAWQDAADEAQRARIWLSRPPPEAGVGEALYQLAELDRLRGDFASAESTYREASASGRRPEPGLAQVRLAQGDVDLAGASIRRALAETTDDLVRARLLEPQVEIAVAAGDLVAAHAAADQLSGLAAAIDAPLLHAMAGRADGVVRLVEGDIEGALGVLRRASDAWRDLDAPYEGARARVWLGRACRELGDLDGAALEFDAAREVFGRLGAITDLAWLDVESGQGASSSTDGLSPREIEVLRLVAAGMTNRAIAEQLTISERTVDRHVSNIFTKLDLSTRTGATAYAYEHDLV